MKRALSLAERGRGYVSPNPLVGAVIVKNGKIVGEGYHEKFGEAHAEVNALDKAGDNAAGTTLYVTMEPCVHHGKTGPCVEKILQSGIVRVVVGMKDPNPLVNGKGFNFLRSKGITVSVDILNEECHKLNEGYVKLISVGRPLITLKIAQTLDGRIATSTGHSKWITAQASREIAHRIRAQHDAILIGVGTILADDPELNVRHVKGVPPKRIILDSQLRVPLDAKVLSDEIRHLSTVVTTQVASKEKIGRIEEKGVSVIVLPEDEKGWVSQNILWKRFAEMGIASVLVEGGSTVITACLKYRNADRLIVFVAPKILGSGIDAVGDLGIRNINSALSMKNMKVKHVNEDIMITADIAFL